MRLYLMLPDKEYFNLEKKESYKRFLFFLTLIKASSPQSEPEGASVVLLGHARCMM